MKKIIAAFDGLKLSESTKAYAIQLAQQTNAHLVGAFLDDTSYTHYNPFDLIFENSGLPGSAKKKRDKKDINSRAVAFKNFETACQKARLDYTIYQDPHTAITELLHESIYADLLIINSNETVKLSSGGTPSSFLRNLLSHVQCPVLVVPAIYKPVNKLVMLYDGEPSSVHAIKMFSYLLSSLKLYPTEVISVNTSKQLLRSQDSILLKEFMQRHFPKAIYTMLKGDAEEEIVNNLKTQQEVPLIILGAYRRGIVSGWFHSSMADTLMKDLKLPLFIAHNK